MSLLKKGKSKKEVIAMTRSEKMHQKPLQKTDFNLDSMFESRLKFTPEMVYNFNETLLRNTELQAYSVKTLRTCPICNSTFVYSVFGNKQYICDSCIKEYEFKKCSHCKNLSTSGSLIRGKSGEKWSWYCKDCISAYFYKCAYCDDEKLKSRFSMYQGKYICDSCIKEKALKTCLNCGEFYTLKEMDHTTKDQCCLRCSLDLKLRGKKKPILSSSHKPSEMVFLSHNQTDKDFLGIELEFQWSSSENRNKILEFLERYEDLYLKEDGSVSSGCEIVTFPATKDYHISRFKKILFEMNQLKCVSYDSGDCGLHIHISRLAFGANTRTQSKNIAKMLYLIEHFQKEVKTFSRREKKCFNSHGESRIPSHPYRYCEFYNLDYSDGKITRAYQRAVYQNKIKIRRSRFGNETIRSGRYKVLNFQNKDTVELRILRGTLNPKTFVACLEFCCLLVKIAKDKTEKELLKMVWNDVVKEALNIPVLIDQFKKLNLVR